MSRDTCPRCDEPIFAVTVSDPTEAQVSPCGCTVPAQLVSRGKA